MRDLRLLHDLPPRWDGRPVVWRGWATPVTFLCGKVHDKRCGSCGSDKSSSINFGLVGDTQEMSRGEVVRDDDAVRRRLKPGRLRRSWLKLTAFRCPDCGHDQVVDGDGVVWDLDESDYSDAGSVST